ncbi:patatin-like phospholipase family protein [Escherichia marmotae]|uniref:Patatin-like phospholipase family protein n=1 Tax=Escherichia marmotae TaxID=1499973 RepID=A0A7W3AJF4_9ESCH|nr:patatin-like phospholipase family protein [Escherichia marmotae]MBA7898508.1 patatin-like phospholipase family protein [Escherichia marmotae]QLW52497.1 patatin-like phospholipase family protein [Escherichia marmotae]
MNATMKIGLVLSGGGAIGAYEGGVVKALAECGVQINMVSGASIGALNGAILASSASLSEAAERLENLWRYLGNNKVLSPDISTYVSLLIKFASAMKLSPGVGLAGMLFNMFTAKPPSFYSDEPLMTLIERYLDIDSLAKGLPLYVSLYPTKGVMQDLFDCISAELGMGDTQNSIFRHVQSLPREQQKEALLASAALPLLFTPREVQGTMYSDGGIGGWKKMQGNTPAMPLIENGCNMLIVTHLSDGSLWDREEFPNATIIEIRPRRKLKGDGRGGLLSFTAGDIDSWYQQGYEDTMLTMERILKPLVARRNLKTSEIVLQNSLDVDAYTDAALKNAMMRLK